MRYVCNVFTIAMAPKGGLLDFEPIVPERARFLIQYPDMGPHHQLAITHAVGHEQTAQLANNQLAAGPEEERLPLVKFARISVQLEPGDDLIICQYIGPRLPEGITVLPEGAEIRWYYAVYNRHSHIPEPPE